MNLRPSFFLCLFIFFSIQLLLGQNSTFQCTIGGDEQEYGYQIVELSDGYVAAGSVSKNITGQKDACLVKIDFSGNLVWQKTYGGNDDDGFTLITKANDGGLLAMGGTKNQGAGGKDVLLVKTDNDGNPQWTKTIGGSADDESTLQSKILAFSNGYIICGQQYSVNGTEQSFVVKLDNNGNTIWSKSYLASGYSIFNCAFIVADTIFFGGTANGDGCFGKINFNNGNLLYFKRFGDYYNEALYNVMQTQDNNLLMSDASWSPTSGSELWQWLLKIQANGKVIWSKMYSLPGRNIRGLATNISDGGFLLIPYTPTAAPENDAYLAKISAKGDIQWAYRYGGPKNDQLYYGTQTSDGGFIAVGNSVNSTGNNDILIVKTDANGHIQGCCNQSIDLQTQDFSAGQGNAFISTEDFGQDGIWNMPSQPANFNEKLLCLTPTPIHDTLLTTCIGQSIHFNGVDYIDSTLIKDTIVTANGCDSISITRIAFLKDDPSCCGYQKLQVPNAFSPNGDGLNDLLCVLPKDNCTFYKLSIFNRWGQLVFQSNEQNPCWDGQFGNKPADSDVYAWFLDLYTAGYETKTGVLKGGVTLLR